MLLLLRRLGLGIIVNTFFRITENDNRRVTENGNKRITENG